MGAGEDDWRRRKHLFRHGGLYYWALQSSWIHWTKMRWRWRRVSTLETKLHRQDTDNQTQKTILMCNTAHQNKLMEQPYKMTCHYPNTVWQSRSPSSSLVRCRESRRHIDTFPPNMLQDGQPDSHRWKNREAKAADTEAATEQKVPQWEQACCRDLSSTNTVNQTRTRRATDLRCRSPAGISATGACTRSLHMFALLCVHQANK